MENVNQYLRETRNIKVILPDITPIKQIKGDLVLYSFDKKSYQTTHLINNNGRMEVKKNNDTKQKLKLINKGGSFKNNPFIAPAIPEDIKIEIAEQNFNDINHYDEFPSETIYITEGLEDALTIREITGCETWAVIGFWNFIFSIEDLPEELVKKLTDHECICVLDRINFSSKLQYDNHSKIINNHSAINDYKISYIPIRHEEYKDTNDYLKDNKKEELTQVLSPLNSITGTQLLEMFTLDIEEQKTADIGLILENEIILKKSKENIKIISELSISSFDFESSLRIDNKDKRLKIFKTPLQMMHYLECWDYFSGWKDLSTSTPFICFRNSKGEREYYKPLKTSAMINNQLVSEIFINEQNELEKVYFNQVWKNIFYLDEAINLRRVKDFFYSYMFNSKIGAGCHFLKDFSKEKGFCSMDGKLSYNISEKLNLVSSWSSIEPWEEDEYLELYKDFILEVACNYDVKQAFWLHNWIASAVQDPLKEKWHCKTSLYFNSAANSTGKTLLAVNIIGMLLSGRLVENCPVNVAKMNNKDWSDKFAYQELNNKLLCVCNELGGGANFYEIIKDIIDSPTVKIEHKFKDTYKIKNTCRFIFTTNDNKLPIKEQDVRLAIFRFNTSWIGTDKIKKLAKLFDTRTFNLEFCKYLFEWYRNFEVIPEMIKDSYKSHERNEVINENMNELESVITDIKELNIDIHEVYKQVKGSWNDLPESICLRDVSLDRSGYHYVKSIDLLQYLKKHNKIFKSSKAFTQLLLNNNIEYIEYRRYKYFKIAGSGPTC